ncbi:hypothetical protein JCM14469_23760 [Desulfatiferula olefinivorans]
MFEEYLDNQFEVVAEFRSALDLESDRGCALLAISFLEEELKILLKKCLVDTPEVDEKIFSFNGPLGTFSSKIEMVFLLGKISKTIKDELNLLRKIRNDFGHNPKPIHFNTHPINERCNSLKGSWKKQSSSPRQHFTASVCSVLAVLHAVAFVTKHPYKLDFEFPFSEIKEEYEEKIMEISKLIKNIVNIKG